MAKISAYGDFAVQRWVREDGARLVYTKRERFLQKLAHEATYHILPWCSREGADHYAKQNGWTPK